jgi:3-oxoacyl-[acyl-carrier-protein] synthase II
MSLAITGASALAAGATSCPALWQLLLQDQLLPERILETDRLGELAGLSTSETSVLSRQQLLGLAAVESAWQQAGLPIERQLLRGESRVRQEEPWRLRAGVISASALGNLSTLLADQSKDDHRPSATSLSRWRGNALGAAVAVRYGLQGDQYNLNAASSSGAQAIGLASQLLLSGILDLVVVVAAEPALEPLLREANRRTGALDPTGSSKPLNAERRGMVPREAAGCIVIERDVEARKRGATVLAFLLGSASGCEAHHLVVPLPGQALSHQLVERLFGKLNQKGLSASTATVDWLCLHATGTERFDREEMAFVLRAFPQLPWITAMKRSLGHGLGAAGVVEAALIIEGLKRAEVPPWPSAVDPALGLPEKPAQPPPRPKLALQLACGMGGVSVINLFANA